MIALTDFIKKYIGIKVGTTKDNLGQCTGLVHKWRENLGLSIFWGHAKDLYANAPSSEYKKIRNTSGAYPASGDIIVWTSVLGGGYGHTAIAILSNSVEDSVTVFEQNNPTSSAPRIHTYTNWNGIYGWLHPLNVPAENLSLTEDIPSEVEDRFKLKEIKRYNKHWTYEEFIKDWIKLALEYDKLEDSLKKQLLELSESLSEKEGQYLLLLKEKNALEFKIKALEATSSNQLKKINDLVDFEEKYILLLKRFDGLSKEHEELLKKYDNLTKEKDEEYRQTVEDLEKRVLELQRPTPKLSEAIQMTINALKEVLKL